MDCQVDSSLFYKLPESQINKILIQPVQAFCCFQIASHTLQNVPPNPQKGRTVSLQIRSNYLLQLAHIQQKIISGVTLNYFVYLEDLKRNQFNQKQSNKNCSLQGILLRIFNKKIFDDDFPKQKNNKNPLYQQIYLNSESQDLAKFKEVIKRKQIIIGIQNIKQIYKPNKVINELQNCKIYEAISKQENKKYFMKAYPLQKYRNQKQYSALLQYLCSRSELTNEHILPYVRIFSTKNTIYRIQKLLHYNLFVYCKKFRCSLKNTKSILLKILQTIGYLHEKKIILKNLSEESILIECDDLTGTISDFALTGFSGVIKYNNQSDINQQQSQYPNYYQQFQFQVQKNLIKCGQILYLMLTGKTVYQIQALNQISYRPHLVHEIVQQLDNNKQIPTSAVDLFKMLSMPEEERAQGAREALQHEFFKHSPEHSLNQKVQRHRMRTEANYDKQ